MIRLRGRRNCQRYGFLQEADTYTAPTEASNLEAGHELIEINGEF